MYATREMNGGPAIQRNGQSVLKVCGEDWEFANWLCSLLNELALMPDLLPHDRIKAMNSGYGREA